MEKIQKDTDRDFFMTAEQAKDYRIVDEVISSKPRHGRSARRGLAAQVRSKEGSDGGSGARRQRHLKCSFCGKSQNDVRKLIAGRRVHLRRVHDFATTSSPED